MDGFAVFIILLAVYLSVLIGIGYVFSGRQRSITDFWLAGREVGTANLGLSAAASWLTAGALLAVTGFFMLSGLGSIWGFVFPNIAALLIIAFLARRIRGLPAITQPEILEQRYGAILRAPVALIIVITMILFAVADIKGFAYVLQVFYDVPPFYAALIVAIAVSIYVGLGGLSAVVWTDALQFMFLAGLALIVGGAALTAPIGMGMAPDVGALMTNMSAGWWNPASMGVPLILVFVFGILPGWMAEQDPWQRVWAARDDKSATRGMALGAGLIALVFTGCLLAAIGLTQLYPEIVASGDPVAAEQALLTFIMERSTPTLLALAAIGLAAASMSCADTFATSGASCVARDIYQRFIRPDATMRQMIRVNRITVVGIVLAATVISFFMENILEAVHIATYIASAAYFFPLMGGLFWKRATKEGALAALVIGGGTQIILVILAKLGAMPWLFEPALMSQFGVLLGLGLSAIAYVGVSLATTPTEDIRLAGFFPDVAQRVIGEIVADVDPTESDYKHVMTAVEERRAGDRLHLHLALEAGDRVNWRALSQYLRNMHPTWVCPTGEDSVYSLTNPDMLSCVRIMRGDEEEVWFSCEPRADEEQAARQRLYKAFNEVCEVLQSQGHSPRVVKR